MESALQISDNTFSNDSVFLARGGEMGKLTRRHDWASTPLGPPENWPQSLRTAVRILLNTHHPMFIYWGPDLIQFYNDAYSQTMGPERHPSALGQSGRECWAEIWHIIGPQIDFVMAGHGATWHEDQLVPVTRFGEREDVWWTYGFSPIDDESGNVGGVLVVCNDVTKRVVADKKKELLSREMSHRVKNTLATVQAIARQTLRDGETMESARKSLDSRLLTLSRAQDILLNATEEGTDLTALVESVLAHHDRNRFDIDAQPLLLSSAATTALALTLHELSTNAAKYGALSTLTGRVRISWTTHCESGDDTYWRLRWVESGGPAVSEPERRGFGSRLIERSISAELGGESTMAYEPDGVVCIIEAPLSKISET